MKATRDKILVEVDLDQKSDYEIYLGNTGQKIYMNSDFGLNGRETNSVVAKAICDHDELGIKENDYILCHHNTFKMVVSYGYLYGDTGMRNGKKKIFSIDKDKVNCKIDPNGDAIPIKGYNICKRIEESPETFLEMPDSVKKTNENIFQLVIVEPENPLGLPENCKIIAKKYADYEILYNFEYKLKSAIRVKSEEILAYI